MKFESGAEIDPVDLWQEIDAARKHTDANLESWDEIQEQYSGGTSNSGPDGHDVTGGKENLAWGFAGWVTPHLVWDNPAVEMKSERGPDAAKQYEIATNRWIQDTDLSEELLPLGLDHTLMWGVMNVRMEPDPKLEERPKSDPSGNPSNPPQDEPQDEVIPLWPTVSRIPQHRYFMDPDALKQDAALFQGHRWIRSRAELLSMAEEDDTWNKEVIEEYQLPSTIEDETRKGKEIPAREEIEAYEVWMPGYTLEDYEGEEPTVKDGYHGTIFTVVCYPRSSKDVGKENWKKTFLREPIPWRGPRWGPYILFGCATRPNEAFPLSPIVAMKGAIDRLNRADKAIQQGAEDYKVPILYDSKDTRTAKALQAAEGGQLIGVPNLFQNGKQSVLMGQPMGGIEQVQLIWRDENRSLVDRYIGFTDTQRGMASGGVTATAETIAAANADVRLEFIKKRWLSAVTRLLKTVAWYIAVDDEVYVPFGPDDAEALGQEEGSYGYIQGGDLTPEDFDRLQLQITPYSMERTDEGGRQRRGLELSGVLQSYFPWILQVGPAFPWPSYFEWLGDLLNMPELSRFFSEETIANMFGMGQQMQAQGQPMMGKELGVSAPTPSSATGKPGDAAGAQTMGARNAPGGKL